MVLPTADVLGKEAAAHSRLLGRCVQGQPNNRSKLFGEHLFFFLWKLLATSYPWVEGHPWLLPLLYPTFTTKIHKIVFDTPLHIHQFIGILTHGKYIIFRDVFIISCYNKENGIKLWVGCKIYFCFLCHDNMTGLLSTLYITKMTSPSSDYQYGKIWTCERYQHDQTSNRYGKIIKVGKIWAWGGSHGVIYWYIDR